MERPPATLDADNAALFLDVDGTLLDFLDHPDDVVADDDLKALLEDLHGRLGGALALISGRTIASLDRIFAPLRLPAAGGHGVELRADGAEAMPAAVHRVPDEVLVALEKFSAAHDGVLVEIKPGGAALHYRRAPQLERQCRERVLSLMEHRLGEFRVLDGNMVLEIASAAANKGEAILALLHAPAFAGRRPVFLGDDVTDEDGFRAVNAVGGLSIRVGERPGSVAKYAVDDTIDVRRWLEQALDAQA